MFIIDPAIDRNSPPIATNSPPMQLSPDTALFVHIALLEENVMNSMFPDCVRYVQLRFISIMHLLLISVYKLWTVYRMCEQPGTS